MQTNLSINNKTNNNEIKIIKPLMRFEVEMKDDNISATEKKRLKKLKSRQAKAKRIKEEKLNKVLQLDNNQSNNEVDKLTKMVIIDLKIN